MDKKILSKLQAQCARREYCSRDIYSKALKALDGDDAAAAQMLESLVSDGFVSDSRYAAAFAREKSGLTGWGPIKIRQALAAKGLGREDIAAGLSEIEQGRAGEKLRKLLSAKWKTLRDDPQGKLKLIRFALSRGYEYDTVGPAVEEVIEAGC